MTVTIEAIKAEQTRLAEMIARFEAQSETAYVFPKTQIDLKPGEHYAGIILGKDGEPSYHLILLPGEIESADWNGAKWWASEKDGELPTRREQALLYANLKEQFKEAWYWSSAQHVSYSDYAWYQNFINGYQNYYFTDYELRARAVRRLIIE